METDLLGQRKVPAHVYWGIHTLRALENYQFSNQTIGDTPYWVTGLAKVKKATALANHDLGILPDEKAGAIVWACNQLISSRDYDDQFPIDVFQGGAGTSVNMNANEVIANLALEYLGKPKGDYDVIHPNDHVNMSQSTNDAYPTALRLAIYRSVEELAERHVKPLQESFAAKATEFASILKMGRTEMQDAVPMTVGQEFQAFSGLMAEERKHLEMLTGLLLEVNLGATAIGTGINAPPGFSAKVTERLQEVTGRPVVMAQDLVEATSDSGAYVSTSAGLKRLAVKLSKIASDLRLLSSGPRAGLNEINLPELAAGSSIMPAKVNPVIPEVVSQVAFNVIGNDLCVTMAAEAGQLQLNAMEPVIAQVTFESISLLAAACDALRTKCVDGITVNKDTCERYVRESIGLVTYLNSYLGHSVCDEIGKECAATGKSVREVVLGRGLMTAEALDAALSLSALVAR
jgi:aspartate ammonia-lyase